MANPEHLKILKQGVEAWNLWRANNRTVRPELTGVDLCRANLRGASLWDANLSEADLTSGDLWGANLAGAVLKNACLRDTNLRDAKLKDADLRNAQLSNAFLFNADLTQVRLAGAKIEGAIFGRTNLGNLDLSEIEGDLTSTYQVSSSIIGIETLELTVAGLSGNHARQMEFEHFLRHAGVPDHLIEYYRLRFGIPIEFDSAFISYSHSDKAFTRRLHDQLQSRGIRCWLDERQMKVGDKILPGILGAIRIQDKVLLCCSKSSLLSKWVNKEIEAALQREMREERQLLLPLNLDGFLFDGYDGTFVDELQARLAADFTGWEHDDAMFDDQFDKVLEALRTDGAAWKKTPEPTR